MQTATIKTKRADTYVDFESRKWKYPGRGLLLGHVPIELVASAIPLDRVERRVLQVVVAAQRDRVPGPHGSRHRHSHAAQRPASAPRFCNQNVIIQTTIIRFRKTMVIETDIQTARPKTNHCLIRSSEDYVCEITL